MSNLNGRYSNVLGFIGSDDDQNNIASLQMSFDVDFSASINNINNGVLSLWAGYYDEYEWLVYFDGNVQNNLVEFNLLADSKIIDWCDGNCGEDAIDLSDSRMQGAFVDNGTTPALLTSFYFRQDDDTLGELYVDGKYVSGLALVSRDERLSLTEIQELESESPYTTLIVDESGWITPGQSFNSDTGSLIIALKDNEDDFQYSAILTGTSTATTIGGASDTVNSVGGFDVDWGFWSATDLKLKVDPLSNNESANSMQNYLFTKILNSTDIADRSGTYHYIPTGDFLGTGLMSNGEMGTLTDFDMNFDIDFTSYINFSSGYLMATLSDGVDSDTWNVTFSGGYGGSLASGNTYKDFYSISGSVTSMISGSSSILTTSVNGDIDGVSTGSMDSAGFVSAFSLYNSSGDEFIQGLGLLRGFIDDRITGAEAQQLNHHTALLVEDGAVSFGASTHPPSLISPLIGVNSGQNFASLDLDQPFDEIRKSISGLSKADTIGGSAAIEESLEGFEVDWGYWQAGDMKILDNNMDASSYITSSNDMLWANIIASPDIADRSGTWFYSASSDFLGNSTGGYMTAFSMFFGIDFDASNNQISSGYLDAVAGTGTWSTSFTGGSLQGALAEFSGITGDYSGYPSNCSDCVTGDIRGVFTGIMNGSDGGGFVAGFSLANGLGDTINGLGLLTGSNVPPI